jgi:hypothetical protein
MDVEIQTSPDCTKAEPNIDIYDWFRFGLIQIKYRSQLMLKTRLVWKAPKTNTKKRCPDNTKKDNPK